jgi:hypothetical protein
LEFNRFSAAALALACVLAGAGTDVSAADPNASAPRSVSEIRCDTGNVVVRSPVRADARIACAGSRAAIVFMASHGLDVESPITIEIVDTLPEVAGPSAVGCYLDTEKRVMVLDYAEFKRRKTWFGLPVNRSLYRSLVAHEVAHSIAACNFREARPVIAAQEYVAYVTTFATMLPTQREFVLAQYPGDGFDSEEEMSTTIYLLDPTRFGVESYRHFLRPANGRDYLRSVLAGRVLLD